MHLGQPVSPSTVNDCLSEHSHGKHPRFVRVAAATYALIQPAD
jgi:hypothetical protein